jgi:hypothetical protein
MNEVRVLVMTNFTYTYGSSSYKQCGDSMYFNPSSSEQLDELKFLLDSSYMKKGWLYVEENIKEDFKNRVGIFANTPLVTTEIKVEPIEVKSPVIKTQEQLAEESRVVESTISLEDRKAQLEEMKAAEVRVIAEGLELEAYTNKVNAIEYILEKEYK